MSASLKVFVKNLTGGTIYSYFGSIATATTTGYTVTPEQLEQAVVALEKDRAASNIQWWTDGALNVRWFGAVGDGSTDDKPAFQAACDMTHAKGGGLVYVPAGTFKLNSAATVNADTTLVGLGTTTTNVLAVASLALGGNCIVADYSDSSGSPGSASISKNSGRAAIASGASVATITNTLCKTTSKVLAQLETVAAGVAALVVVPGAGSFTVTSVNGTGVVTNTTANATFSFVLVN